LREEVHRYNDHQVHATTKDVFCLRETRVIDGYRRISLFNHTIEVPNAHLHKDIDIHVVPGYCSAS
jgi:hypothetical protein